MNGKRIFYTHIDGDGVVNRSHVDQESYSGDMILKEVFKKYPDIPMTASLITGYFDLREYQHEKVMKMYRSILSLPNTEVASHGHLHPFIWKKYKVAFQVPGYRYSDEGEIFGSVEKLRSLLKKWKIPKKVGLFLWTGDCRPMEHQLAIVDRHQLLNMNGGDSRFDRRYDSYAFLAPLGLLRGKHRQIYASASNENIYTNKWEGPYYGFDTVIETFQNTESPIRIKPMNVYYHYYSGEVAASLVSLKKVYEYALKQDIFPMFASEYAAMASDFFSIKMQLLPEGGYRILNQGFLRTIRFDDEKRNVYLTKSRGVIGFQHFQGALYVFLDDGLQHDIYLTKAKPQKPYVARASFHVSHLRGNQSKVSFEKQGWYKSHMVLGGLSPHRGYRIRAGGKSWKAKSNGRGELRLRFPEAENGGDPVAVHIVRNYP